jgi:hypothetical protein
MARFNKLFVKKLFMPDGKNKAQLDKMTQVTATASEINTGLDGLTATAAELNIMDDATLTTAELNQKDASANNALITTGLGVSAGSGTIVKYGMSQNGGIITTQILIDITGLQSGGAHDDIFGDPVGAGAKSHFGQITTAVNGVVWGGEVRCLETPVGCNVDIDFNTGTDDAGAQDAGVAAITGYAQLADCGNHTALDAPIELVAPAANTYLYLSAGVTTDVVASAGRFLITLWGYVA